MVIAVSGNVKQGSIRLQAYKNFLEKRLGDFIPSLVQQWRVIADLIVEEIIYNAYEPLVYKRGRDRGADGIDSAVKVSVESGQEAVLFIDSALTPDKASGGYGRGYAAYFLKGDGFLAEVQRNTGINVRPLRDFMGDSEDDTNQWVGMTNAFFVDKYMGLFERAVKAANAAAAG